jgi:hypothetical protein
MNFLITTYVSASTSFLLGTPTLIFAIGVNSTTTAATGTYAYEDFTTSGYRVDLSGSAQVYLNTGNTINLICAADSSRTFTIWAAGITVTGTRPI